MGEHYEPFVEVSEPEQPSDVLRRAATALREHAEAAGKDEWAAQPVTQEVYNAVDNTTVADLIGAGSLAESRARYIALVDPTVGLALADWLDKAAEVYEAEIHDGYGVSLKRISPALAVARAILREADDA